MVNGAIEKAKAIPRQDALKKVEKKKQQRPVVVVQYNPRLPFITTIARRHWRTMVTQDPQLQEMFPDPPLIAYKVAQTQTC